MINVLPDVETNLAPEGIWTLKFLTPWT
jgi:hypothetical protein